ncbi:sigma-54-dependent Fis family transcriptional regulator [Fusibacter ferrireducens]|uniref:Sigma-54-dependent Fis family transcriptional regulator n=1 Tax=Fusibacter ferrireducens TaxID=2785058 RepID=A0ABR9ZUD6_9FIRM|nr:sigma-54-dependent Fis family transcriptional regulator [Fusibacter ferrireducens]MBF4694067.1 sigma-54-dependent Fis family transcriptional regulator [Fusibacter ferrireducens]
MIKKSEMLLENWESFVGKGQLKSNGVKDEIYKSWLRCKDYGVEPTDDSRHVSLSKEAFDESLKEKAYLIKIAHPFMLKLYKFVRGTGFVVVLVNEEGYLLELFADEDVWQNPVTKNFFLGASWQEEVAGTNAIGTAMYEQAPVQVSGAEHYCKKHHGLTCSAAPIFDVNGDLLGIVDISGPFEASHGHTLGMVVATAEAIMAQLRIENKNRQLALANKKLLNFFNMVSDGVLIVGEDGSISEMNPAAEVILRREKKDAIGMLIQNMVSPRHRSLGSGCFYLKPCSYIEGIIHTSNGPFDCIISSEPIYNEKEALVGSFITLKQVKQVQKLLDRFGGYTASLQFEDIIGSSFEIRESIRLANLTAINNSNVLLTGESGTGKEIFAQAIHNKSSQCNAPFVSLNCGAIPRELIGSELFGYEEGAFTGAKRGGKPGKFELAAGGTLFLDEIGDMPLEHQTVLLRVIQEKQIVRIGGDKMISVNARLICATNKNLFEEVEKGTFRRDLFYRLNVMAIMIPPLRNRVEDIPLLFRHFLNKLCNDRERTVRVDRSVYEYLKRYSWLGNVRELQNVVERAVNLAENGIIFPQHLPERIRNFQETPSKEEHVVGESLMACRVLTKEAAKETEKNRIIELLNRHAGNVSRVALEMGLSRKTIYNKMKLHEIYK